MVREEYIDLHLHSNCSDGYFSPNDLIDLALAENLTTIAITDHDNVSAYNKINQGRLEKLRVIKGIEMTAYASLGQMHILGYGIDVNHEELKALNVRSEEVSRLKIIKLIAILRDKYQINFDDDDIKMLMAKEKNIGRPDIANLLLKMKVVSRIKEAFDKYLIEPYEKLKEAFKDNSYEKIIDVIIKSGGIPVLAHPKTLLLDDNEFSKLLKDLINCGLQGLEVFHSSNDESDVTKYLKICQQNNLLYSGGSDFHGGKVKPNIFIGFGAGNSKIKKLSILNHL